MIHANREMADFINKIKKNCITEPISMLAGGRVTKDEEEW